MRLMPMGMVAFQHYAVGARMFGGGKQLQVQIELDVVVDGNMRIVGRVRPAQCLYLLGIVGGILGATRGKIRGSCRHHAGS